MGKIKIHEIAKLLGLGSKEVVTKAQELGVEATSHMSAVKKNRQTESKQVLKVKKRKLRLKRKNNKIKKVVIRKKQKSKLQSLLDVR